MKTIIALLLIAFGTIAAMPADAQLADKKALTLAEAKKLIGAAEAAATKGEAHMSFAILDDGAHLVLFQRMDGASLVTGEFAIKKARTSVMYKAPSKVFGEGIAAGRTAILGLPDAAPFEGGIPLMAGGQLIGAIGCSGGKSPAQDSEVCEAAAATLTK